MWDRLVHQLLSCSECSPPWLPISTPPTGLDECFFFNSLIVGLPYNLIFWQFWLFFCCPSFGCVRWQSVSTSATILAIYLFLERGERREKERERNINVWLPLARTWPATQACALTGNRASDPLVCRLALSPLSHTSHVQNAFKGDVYTYPTHIYFKDGR